ncbi:MAG: peptidylprolyl isomerase [Candidatus Aminicenantes bacterium]|nr:peptidylprolyl isomerase [Acidobacteriota bacterium]MCG2810592.1 peptidylprolyl isomerase [Candidatus Aminicenantes bacterium]
MKRKWIFWLAAVLLVIAVPAQENKTCILETEKGTLVFQMYPGIAPRTVARISELAESGFFDGIVFHRVVADFVVQAGDPTGSGEGGSGQTIAAEFSHLHYIRGSLGMARDDDINSNDSQFFICITDQPHLDGKYTLFGQVISGAEVLDKIRQGDKILSMRMNKE